MTTSATLCVTPDTLRSAPSVAGLDVSESEWRLDLTEYETFIEAVTGIAVGPDLSDSDSYRIRNRLEALVAERYRTGEWPTVVREACSGTMSPEDVVELARFFRFYLDCRQAADPVAPGTAD